MSLCKVSIGEDHDKGKNKRKNWLSWFFNLFASRLLAQPATDTKTTPTTAEKMKNDNQRLLSQGMTVSNFYHVSVAWEHCTSAHLGKILRGKWMMCYSEDSEEAMDDVLSRARDDWDSNDLEHQWAIIGGEALLSAESFSQICSDQSRNGITHWQLELLVKLNEK